MGAASPDPRHVGEQYYGQAGYFFRVDVLFSDPHSFQGLPAGLTATRVVVPGDNNNYYRFEGFITEPGNFTVYRDGNPDKVVFHLQVYPPSVAAIAAPPPEGVRGQLYSFFLNPTATKYVNAKPYDVPTLQPALITGLSYPSGLPDGLTGELTGQIVGVPTEVWNVNYPGGSDYPATLNVQIEGRMNSILSIPIRISLPLPTVTNSGTVYGEDTAVFPGTLAAPVGGGYQITTLADDLATSYTAGGPFGLPPGLSLNTGSGLISGTPAVGVTDPQPLDMNWPITLTATNLAGTGAPVVVNFNVIPHRAPLIYSPLTATAIITQNFTYQIQAYFLPTSFNATGLPAGLSIDTGTGVISGVPSVFGLAPDYTFSVSISATNAWGTDTETLILTVSFPPPVIDSADKAIGITGTPFSYQITVAPPPAQQLPPHPPAAPFSVDELPPGLGLDIIGGEIAGTPTQIGVYHVTVGASNAGLYGGVPAQPPGTLALTIYIFAGPPVPTSVSPGAIYPGTPVTITGSGFIGGPNAKVMFGNNQFPFTAGTSTTFVSGSTITTTPNLKPSEIPYDILVINTDGQAGLLRGALTVAFPGTVSVLTPRLTSLDTTDSPIYDAAGSSFTGVPRTRVFSLGTNVEVLFYSGRDLDNNQILNVYRRQLGTTSTRHAASDLVFKGVLGIQASPSLLKTTGPEADAMYCLVRSNGRLDVIAATSGIAQTDVTDKAYAAWKATLVRSLDPIPPLNVGVTR